MPTSRHAQAFLVVSTVLITASSAFQTISVVLSRRSFATSLSFSVQEDDARPQQLPSFIQSPVLAKVYPAILAHNQKHGNPNIPLGSENGKRCKTLRRLAFQNKLTSDELEILTEMGFRWNSFEDVYTECDFDEMREKLMAYHDEFDTFQIPKKYEPDPELGAWVTMLRRLHAKDDLPSNQVELMNEIGFEWISTRKCGSTFMTRYREVSKQLSDVQSNGIDASKSIEEDAELRKWLHAQKCVFENGKLSESRVQYMDDLGVDWRNISL